MITLSVIIPYRNRISNLRCLADNLAYVQKHNIEFHLISLGDRREEVVALCKRSGLNYHYLDYHNVFNIGLAHNYGATLSVGEYILKQDVDCIPYVGFYVELLNHIDTLRSNKKLWSNLGVFYCNERFSKECLSDIVTKEIYNQAKHNPDCKEEIKFACGNCFLVNRNHFIEIGGCSKSFEGWGWEDYQVCYFLEKSLNPQLTLSSCTLETIVSVCREEIARPKNKSTNEKDLVFLHKWHDNKENDPTYNNYIEKNRNTLLKSILNFNLAVASDNRIT